MALGPRGFRPLAPQALLEPQGQSGLALRRSRPSTRWRLGLRRGNRRSLWGSSGSSKMPAKGSWPVRGRTPSKSEYRINRRPVPP